MYEWSDLRIFLAVADSGSALAAARDLDLNQSTVNRRIRALERDLGLQLFDRGTRGHKLSRDGEAILAEVRSVESAAHDVQFAAERIRRVVSGTVRVTSPEAFSNAIIIPITSAFHDAYPSVRVEQITADRRLNIVNGEADVAFRAGSHPEDPRLIARRLPNSVWAAYCGAGYVRKCGRVSSPEALLTHSLVTYVGGLKNSPSSVWLQSKIHDEAISYTSNTVTNMRVLLRSNLGIGLLPHFLGDPDPDLVHCFDAPEEVSSEIWLLTSAQARAAPHVRAFIDFAVPRIEAMRESFRGKSF